MQITIDQAQRELTLFSSIHFYLLFPDFQEREKKENVIFKKSIIFVIKNTFLKLL